jgi:hypothetical protein
MKFHEYTPDGNRTVPSWFTDSTNLIVAFRNCFAKARKNLQDVTEEWTGKKLKMGIGTFYEEFPHSGRTDNVAAQSWHLNLCFSNSLQQQAQWYNFMTLCSVTEKS